MRMELTRDPQHAYDFDSVNFETPDEIITVNQAATWLAYMSCRAYTRLRNLPYPELPLKNSLIILATAHDAEMGKNYTTLACTILAKKLDRNKDLPVTEQVPFVIKGVPQLIAATVQSVIGLRESNRHDIGPSEVRAEIVSFDRATETCERLYDVIQAAKWRPGGAQVTDLGEFRKKRKGTL